MEGIERHRQQFYPYPPASGHKPGKGFALTEALPALDTGSNAFRVPAMLLPLDANSLQMQAMVIKETLPSTALDLANLIGLPATLALVEDFGGNELRIPAYRNCKSAALFQKITGKIGEEAAIAISKAYGGDVLYIPSCAKTRRALRDMEIVRAYDALILETSARDAVATLSKQYSLSNRGIEKIVNRPTFSVGG